MDDVKMQGEPPVAEPSPAPADTAPATESIPPAPVLPEKLEGKSAEQIAAQYLELEKKLGEQGRELGELRASIPRYQPPQPQWYPQPAYPEPKFEFDYGKPEESVARIVEARLEKERQDRATYDVGRQEQEAQLNYSAGKDVALKANARLYEGIEPMVEQAVQMAYRQYGLHPSLLRDPKTWERVAQNIRLERGEFDRLTKPTAQPPQPSATGVPNLTRGAKAGVELDDESRKIAKEFGLSEQQARDILEKEREESGR